MRLLNWYWNGLLEVPAGWIVTYLGIDMSAGWRLLGLKIACTVAILLFLYEIYLRVKDRRRRRQYDKDLREYNKSGQGALSAEEKQAVAENPEGIIARLKKARNHEKLGEIYRSLDRPKESARSYQRARRYQDASEQWAKAGYPLKAARLLQKLGSHQTAGRFYLEKKRYRKAAKQFLLAKSYPEAGDAYFLAKRYADSASAYEKFFSGPQPDPAHLAAAAQACAQLLQDPAARAKIPGDQLRRVTLYCGKTLRHVKRPELAAQLFQQAGELIEAGESFLQAGQLEAAARCMQQAGETKRASEIGGRYYESIGKWREAGLAYEGGGAFRRAGDCFMKANEAELAAENYERAGEFYGAGFALVHAKHWEEAVRIFQKLPESSPHFGESRQLLGRAFYELKDYAHCAATLENHLLGERVRKDNIDYFWMLALAYEQLGKLEASREVLLKIRSVDVEYRDVAHRLSSVQSRISMAGAGQGPAAIGSMPTMATPAPEQGKSPVMSMVENSLKNRYELERELGRGGMGVVYKARDTQLDRPVALKFLGSLVDESEEYRLRFQREARAAAQVTHPNILSIYDIGVEQGSSYIAMEYIEGPNLNQFMKKKGKLSAREAVNIVGQACAALDAVHQAGIVHRDIKPDNILIAKGGLVKLMDFGLAKGYGQRLTASNVVMGTPCYMSPEQAKGQDVDGRSDIYAMGMVLYELLIGEPVFCTGNVLMRQIEETPPPPSSRVEDVPPALDALIMKCIAKDPEERYASARELCDALRQLGK
ncbi:MAG: protein kinase [Candidatus Hydrogenedentes bacterium]|nr:protein kinase [Candidatus Hydrogenedentota bacterium]